MDFCNNNNLILHCSIMKSQIFNLSPIFKINQPNKEPHHGFFYLFKKIYLRRGRIMHSTAEEIYNVFYDTIYDKFIYR